ncbi:MAG: DUF1080 domain-containing protein [Gemmataceae bacterium]
MSILRLILVISLVVGTVAGTANAQDSEKKGKWIPLFNGKNLDGWIPKIKGHKAGENYKDTFRVEDGILKVSYDKYENWGNKFGHLFYKKSFSNYIIRVEYRFTDKQVAGGPTWAYKNSGIMIHGQSPESMSIDQPFPVSIEVQLLGGYKKGDRGSTTANLCTPGTHVVYQDKLHKRHCTNSSSKLYRGPGWVTAEVEVRGNKLIVHKVDGKEVLRYSEPQYDPKDRYAKNLIKGKDVMLSGGTISLQSESHPVEFRKVELMVLSD